MHTLPSVQSNGRKRSQRGFTLIELVVVIIVLGLLSTVVMMGGTPLTASRRVNADAMKSAIRYAQSRAIKTGQTWGVSWNGTGYWLFTGANAAVGNAEPLPGETNLTVNFATLNVSVAPTSYTIVFNVAGRPFTDAPLAVPLAADRIVTMTATDDAGVTESFTITAETGYLQ